MRSSKIAWKIQSHGHIKLTTLGHALPRYIAYAAAAGYDGVWLDLEHRSLSVEQVQLLLMTGVHYDIDVLVRPATRDNATLYRLLEDGATGLIIPHVNSIDMATQAVRAAKFPPIGDRGVEAQCLESDYGLSLESGWADLVAHANDETVLCVQIETPSALQAAAEIAALKGVDMLFVGPADMQLRLQQVPEGVRAGMPEVYTRVARIADQFDKPWGSMPRTLDELTTFRAMGARIHVWGRDHVILRNGLNESAAALDEVLRTGQNSEG